MGRMTRRMTVGFHDEDLYTELKVEAVRRHATASDIVAAALREWLESREDAGLLPVVETARAEWKEKNGRPWPELSGEAKESIERREAATRPKCRHITGVKKPCIATLQPPAFVDYNTNEQSTVQESQ
jgi:hypothetical protein